MSSDKRSVTTDALETLGSIISENEHRDAIHLAVEPAIAAHTLRPGEDVGFVVGGVGVCTAPVGIVDPFLKAPVKAGERFWLVVYPRQITSLRHVWTHPAFPENDAAVPALSAGDKDASEAWLRNFADGAGCPGYHALMAKAEEFCDGNSGWSDEYLHFGGSDAHGDIPSEFWTHFEVVTGKKPQGNIPTYFSCSC